MKRIKLFIHEPSINKVIGRELDLLLDDKASLVDARTSQFEYFAK